ncbi:MAG: ABC transporter ATP-binding protein [Gemmatimonadota bacterium]|nr:MAG: ABC transporter ATP-binding protein [Gemmatimonadota bacterium]
MSRVDGRGLVEAEDLHYRYPSGREPALDGLSLRIDRGRVIGLVGPNGSGKTTLYRTLVGFVRQQGGRVVVDGLDPAAYRRSRGIGYLPEQVRLPGNVRVDEFIVLMGRLAGLHGGQMSDAIERLMQVLDIGRAADALVKTLSHGYRQRVGLLAALLGDPELLLLDEPANGLDPVSVGILRSVLRSLKRDGRTVVVSSHNLLELERVCDEILVLRCGRLLGQISCEELTRRPDIWVVQLIAEGRDVPPTFEMACRELGGVRLAADEVAFDDERCARICKRWTENAGGTVEAVEQRRFDLEYLFHSLVQNESPERQRR